MARSGFDGERAWMRDRGHVLERPRALTNEALGSCAEVDGGRRKEEMEVWPGTRTFVSR